MTTITLKINQNAGPNFGFPIGPPGWVATGAMGTTDTRYYINPADGKYVKPAETDPATGVTPLHDAEPGYQASSIWKDVTGLSETPYNSNQVVLHRIAEDGTVKPAPCFVPGRTMAQAQALGDVWGFTRDPNAG